MHNSQNYISIRFTPDGFSLSWHDENNVMASKYVAVNYDAMDKMALLQLVLSQPELSSSNCKIVYNFRYYTFIPKSFFAGDLLDSYLSITNVDKDKFNVKSELIHGIDAVLVYAIPEKIDAVVAELIKAEKSVSDRHFIAELFSTDLKRLAGEYVYLMVSDKQIDVIAMQNGNLILVNSYDVSAKEDVAFYVLSVYNQIGFGVDRVPLYVRSSTDLLPVDALLKEYIANCSELS